MAKLDNNITEKILRIVKPYHQQDEYELNYVIVDNEITFFASINESEQIPEEVIEQIASALDGVFVGCELVNQEYRYKFNLEPCN